MKYFWENLHIGEIVYLSGNMTTCRDVAHRRLVEEGRHLPVNIKDEAIYHADPIIRQLEKDKIWGCRKRYGNAG